VGAPSAVLHLMPLPSGDAAYDAREAERGPPLHCQAGNGALRKNVAHFRTLPTCVEYRPALALDLCLFWAPLNTNHQNKNLNEALNDAD
jgi:hypothetical protein